MKGMCALYDIEAELQESHIYPKFVVNYTRRTGSNYLRNFVKPNVRLQDGLKLYLLSRKAEQEFSVREKWFAENIFIPYLEGKHELSYNENLYYFSVSFLWRVIALELRKNEQISTKWYYEMLLNAEKEWKRYLVTGILPTENQQICLFFTDRVKENNTDLIGVDYYFTRMLDATIVCNPQKTSLMIYGKFSRFVFWAILKNYGSEKELTDVKVDPKGGIFKIPQQINYFPITSFWGNRIRQIDTLKLPSEEQQRKIDQEILKDTDSFWKSDLGQSLYNDKFNLQKPPSKC